MVPDGGRRSSEFFFNKKHAGGKLASRFQGKLQWRQATGGFDSLAVGCSQASRRQGLCGDGNGQGTFSDFKRCGGDDKDEVFFYRFGTRILRNKREAECPLAAGPSLDASGCAAEAQIKSRRQGALACQPDRAWGESAFELK